MTEQNAENCGKILELKVQASHKGVDYAAALLERSLVGQFTVAEIFGVILGFREAMTNAVVHGSGSNPEETIRCEAMLDCDKLSIAIEDNGSGFCLTERFCPFPDPKVEGRRGLGIIKCYFDEFNYNEKGNKLLLTKRRL